MNTFTTHIKGGRWAVYLTAFLLFYKIKPYFFWHGIFSNNYFNAIITIIIGLFFFLNRKKMNGADKKLMILFGFILASYPFFSAKNFNVFVSIIPLLFIPFATDGFNKKVYNSFLNIYCVIIGISLIVWVLVTLGLLQPLTVIKPLNEVKEYNYYVYPLLVTSVYSNIRFFGPFDEPGVVGTISGLFFCCQNKFDSKQSIVLLSGVCSMSLFFFIIVAMYYTYRQLLEKGNMKSLSVYVVLAIAAIGVILYSPTLSEKIISRLAWDSESGSIVGDNRTSEYAWELLDQIKGTRQFWFGIDYKEDFHEKVLHSSSFVNVVVMNGMLFSGLILIFYIAYGWVYKRTVSGFLVFVVVVLGTLYQRPGIFLPEFIFLWIFLARKEITIYGRSLP